MELDNHENPGQYFSSVIRELKSLALSNMEYYQNGNHSHHAKFHTSCCLLYEYLDLGIEPSVASLLPRLAEFDVSPEQKGNGYRSLLRVVQKCCMHLVQLLRHITVNRDSVLFRRAYYGKEIEAYVATLGQLRACLYYAQKLITYCENGTLFADEERLNEAVAEQLMMDVEMLNQDCFYGRCFGFQFCESMQKPLHVVSIAMASFSEAYQENSHIMQLATSLISSGKYFMNPELRAQQVVNITRTADVGFCKAFWGITENDIMKQMPSLVCPQVHVDEVISLGPDSFEMPTDDGSDTVIIVPPCAHTGPGAVKVRLISFQLLEGQEIHMKKYQKSHPGRAGCTPRKIKPKSPGLVIHCHGGGFVAQSSKSHEIYLRHWAKELNVPILSIDYSLAPEFPFPRALEECFYAYAWAVQNYEKLGSTGESICLAGDSAGGNLMISTAMRAASFGIRCPDGIMAAYAPVLVQYTPSPSRLLSLMDPLLPVGILSRCLAAYAGVSDDLASGLASTVFPGDGESESSLKLQTDESSDSEWIIVTQEENEAGSSQVHVRGQASGLSPMEMLTPSPGETPAMSNFIGDDAVVNLNEASSIVMESLETDTFFTPHEDKSVNFSTNFPVSSYPGVISPDLCIDIASDAQNVSGLNLNNDPDDEFQTVSLGDASTDTDSPSGFEIICDTKLDCDGTGSSFPSISTQLGESVQHVTSSMKKSEESVIKCESTAIQPDWHFCNTRLNGRTASPAVSVDASSPQNGSHDRSNHVDTTTLPQRAEMHPISGGHPLNRSGLQLNLTSQKCDRPFDNSVPLPHSPSAPVFKTNVRNHSAMSPADFSRHRHSAQSPLHAIRRLPIVKNPYMSPLLAPDHMLEGLPDLYLVACHLDPILDDSIMLTKRMHKLGKMVDLHLVHDLPHGFLNFALVSKEAKLASEVCIEKLKTALNKQR